MTRFVHLKNDCTDMLINTRAIVGVSNLDDEIVTVELFDGSTHRVDRSFLYEITGDNAIIQLYNCRYLAAVYKEDDDTDCSAPVGYMALTAAGNLRPMDALFKFMDVTTGTKGRFLGLGVSDSFKCDQ